MKVECDAVLAAADYAHVETLLPPSLRNYKPAYWAGKTFAPSSLIFYIGLRKKVNLQHHTLFFDEELYQHSRDIYKERKWPAKPLFYVCCPSRNDASVAPHGHENIFLLMPIAPGLEDNDAIREKYFSIMMKRLEKETGEELISFIDHKKSYCVNDFISDYNAYGGNAYGLANTLQQTAVFKPSIRNKKVKNLFYAGQLTVPGPGVPPSLISGKIVAQQLMLHLNSKRHEVTV
jgi:phytoene desaturase